MILVRHAQSEWNLYFSRTRVDPGIADPPLTELGRSQAAALVDQLRGHGVARLVASPYRRTLETAEIIADALDLPITIEPLVRERCFFSCDIGSHPDLLAGLWSRIDFTGLDASWWGEPPETEEAVVARCDLFRAKIADWPERRNIAVISHWGFIRAFTGLEVENARTVRCTDDHLIPSSAA